MASVDLDRSSKKADDGSGTRAPSAELTWRTAEATDARAIGDAIEAWWDRHINHHIQPQFLEHFGDTTLLVEERGELVAFLVGVISQRYPGVAYVHFMGVHREYWGRGIGRELYRRFAQMGRERGCTELWAETGAFNRNSIAFHRRIGFDLVPTDLVIDGLPVHRDEAGIGADYVEFRMDLTAAGSL